MVRLTAIRIRATAPTGKPPLAVQLNRAEGRSKSCWVTDRLWICAVEALEVPQIELDMFLGHSARSHSTRADGGNSRREKRVVASELLAMGNASLARDRSRNGIVPSWVA